MLPETFYLLEDSSSNADITSKGTFFVDIVAFDSSLGGLEACNDLTKNEILGLGKMVSISIKN